MDLFSSQNSNIDEITSGKTIAGYEFTNFSKLQHPVERPNRKPLKYCAKVITPEGNIFVVFDEDGICNNPALKNCNIDLSNCK